MPSRALGLFRGFYVPLGLFALIAVGVHGAADALDDFVLRGVERLDAILDGFWALNPATETWVNRVDALQRTWVARIVALIWEIAVDLVAALPCLNYFEDERSTVSSRTRWRDSFRRLNQTPTLMRLLRPAFAAIFALGGSVAVAQAVESALFEQFHALDILRAVAAQAAQAGSVAAGVLILVCLAWRCVAFAFLHADAASEKKPGLARSGLVGNLITVPLAVASVLNLLPLLRGA